MNDMDEFGLIGHLTARVNVTGPDVKVGIGDDCAVLSQSPDEDQVITTDATVEGVHFLRETLSWRDVGYKAVAVSISDVAAMGGIPRHVVLTLAIPKGMAVEDLEALYDGVGEVCSQYVCPLVGGDVVTTSGPFVVTSTVVGAVPTGKAMLRSGARVGDLVFVTGPVGSSGAGLCAMREPTVTAPDDAYILMRAHQHPVPQVEAGIILREEGAASCNDVSDGLASELNEIAKASDVRLRIDAARVPLLPATRNFARTRGEDPLQYAWYGGEDYQLVGTAAPLSFARALSRCQSVGIPLTQIGRVEPGDGVIAVTEHGLEAILPKGYNHFT